MLNAFDFVANTCELQFRSLKQALDFFSLFHQGKRERNPSVTSVQLANTMTQVGLNGGDKVVYSNYNIRKYR